MLTRMAFPITVTILTGFVELWTWDGQDGQTDGLLFRLMSPALMAEDVITERGVAFFHQFVVLLS